MPRPFARWIMSCAALLVTARCLPGPAQAAEALNVLTWCDHEDAALLEPFQRSNNVKINYKDIDSTGAALAVIGQSRPGDWDVLVIDETDAPRLAGMGLLAPLDPNGFPLADIPPGVADPKLSSLDGTLYAVPEKFGYNTVAFDKTRVDPQAMADINAPWEAKYKGRVAIYDYDVPEIAYTALALGKDPGSLTEADLPAIRAKLAALKANAALVGDVTTVQQALATGAADILVGGGEWVTAGLHKDQPNLAYVVPHQGGIRWQQGIAVFASSKRKELATKFAQYILSPEAQAKLATSSCYWGVPANSKAALTDEQRSILDWSEQPKYIANSHPYPQLTSAFDQKLHALWAEVLQGK